MPSDWLRRTVLALSLLTVLVLAWNQFGMDRSMVLDGRSPNVVVTHDDRDGSNHGRSTSWVEREGSRLVLHCNLRAGYQYPFCLMSIRLAQPPQGLDLSGFDTLSAWVAASGPEPRQQLRISIRNFNPGYSRANDEESLKNQEIILHPDEHAPPLEMRLAQFAVASWWVEEHQLPLKYAGLEFGHVVALDVTTGSDLLLGEHSITIDRLELHGKWVPPAQLRLLLVALWLVAALVLVAVDAAATRRALKEGRAQAAMLRQINDALRLESAAHASLARQDPLTGLLNRQGLSDALQDRSRDRLKEGMPLFPMSLVFVDIDRFKAVNDVHGHAVGDEVIRATADCIRQHVQRSDLVARWGGEEFLLVCPNTSVVDASGLAERLRTLLAGQCWPRSLAVTCSFGVAGAESGEHLREGIDRADRAMYEAKRSGRNRVATQEKSGVHELADA